MAAVAALVRLSVMRARVAGTSMEPALAHDDRVLASRLPLLRAGPRAGDIVLVRVPHVAEPIIKRVVERTSELGAVTADHAVGQASEHRGRREPWYIVLGDNSHVSTDSRHFGPVPASAIIGVVWYRYWPPERRGRLR